MAFGTTAGSAAAGPPRLGPPRVLAFFFPMEGQPETIRQDGYGGFDSGRSSRDVDKRWNRYNRAAPCRAEETESSVQLILGHHTRNSSGKSPPRSGAHRIVGE